MVKTAVPKATSIAKAVKAPQKIDSSATILIPVPVFIPAPIAVPPPSATSMMMSSTIAAATAVAAEIAKKAGRHKSVAVSSTLPSVSDSDAVVEPSQPAVIVPKVIRLPKPTHGNLSSFVDNRVGGFTAADDQKLLDLHGVDGFNWPDVLEAFPGRTKIMIRSHYYYLIRPRGENFELPKTYVKFSADDDRKLLTLHTEAGFNWPAVQENFPNHSRDAVRSHFYFLKRKLTEVAEETSRKTGHVASSVRMAQESDRPDDNEEEYSLVEGTRLLEMRASKGFNWDEVLAAFPDRTKQSLRRHYYWLKKKIDADELLTPADA